MYHQQAMVVDFLLPKKRRKTNPVDVGSYLGNLFAVLPLVRYYWATFCQRQFRGFRASLVFTVPTSPFSSRTICVTFSHFRVNSFTRPSHNSIFTNFHEKSGSVVRPTGSDQLSAARERRLCSRTNRSDTHRFPRFPAPAK